VDVKGRLGKNFALITEISRANLGIISMFYYSLIGFSSKLEMIDSERLILADALCYRTDSKLTSGCDL